MSIYLCHIDRYEIAERSMNEQIASESESSKIIDTICSVRDIVHDSDSAPGKRNRILILEIIVATMSKPREIGESRSLSQN